MKEASFGGGKRTQSVKERENEQEGLFFLNRIKSSSNKSSLTVVFISSATEDSDGPERGAV